jgi:hypothetical protein
MSSLGGGARWCARAVVVALALVVMAAPGCGGSGLFGKVYEYDEDLYVSLDGSADLIVNASIPALAALRGLDVDARSTSDLRDRVRAAYSSPATEVTRVSRPWRRRGRKYVQVRMRVPDVRNLSEAGPFSWSTYELTAQGGLSVFKQTIGPSALRPGTLRNVGWTGEELVAFRLHMPSRITWHNARDLDTNEASDIQRGNILVWEQQLTDRLDGRPIAIEVRMESQSILHRTLWLFFGAFVAALLLIGMFIWLLSRKGASEPQL